jgi:EmrB/QacA subfamily drug resistance transporter
MEQEAIYKNRYLILFNVVLMTFMACIDGSIVNVALNNMAEKLSVSDSSITWVVTSYLIVISATILMFGRLGDIKGKVRVFKWGVGLFTFGSLLCGISNSLLLLIVSRIIQGIGAAGAMATNQGIITQVFPGNERGKALGISGTSVALGSMVGPPLGGFMIDALSWRYIFLINVPIGIFAIIMGMKVLPVGSKKSNQEKFDITGAILFAIAVVAFFCSVSLGGEGKIGYSKLLVILGAILTVVALTVFIIVENKLESPLLQLEIFKNPLFSLSIFCAFISFSCISCMNIIQPFYMQDVMKFSPSVTGLLMMTSPIILFFVAPISGSLSDKIGSELLTFLGLLFTSIGLFLLSTLNEKSSIPVLVAFVIIIAIGNGMFQSPNTSMIMSTVSHDKLGVAGSINALVRNIGIALGVSLSTTLLYAIMSFKLGQPVTDFIQGREDLFVYGMKYVYISAGAVCALGALLTAYRLYARRNDTKKQDL